MFDRESLISELEQNLAHGSPQGLGTALQRITDLFIGSAGALNEDQIALFDDVISRLAGEIETKARAELSRRLAPIDRAPPGAVRRLANDDEIEVAVPVLLRSNRLADADLVEIAGSKSQAHLLAIAGRRRVGEAVTDVLVERGDSHVLYNAVSNPGADFSANGFATLVARSDGDEPLTLRVGERQDIPPHLFRRLLAQASELVRKRLVATASPEIRAEIPHVLVKVAREIDGEGPPPRNFTAAERLMRMLYHTGSLGENELYDVAKSRRYEETVAALSLLCATPIEIVDGLMNGEWLEPLLVLLKAAGYEWLTVRAIILLRPGGRRLAARELADICDDFNRLSYATARRVLQHWQELDAGRAAAG